MWRLIARWALTVLLVGLWIPVAEGADPPTAVLPDVAFHFGKAVRGAVIEHEFVLRNEGGSPLTIHAAHMTTPLRVERLPREILPGGEARVRFRLGTAELEGPFNGQVAILLNDPRLPEARLTFTGHIVRPVELAPMGALLVAAQRGQAKGRRSRSSTTNRVPSASSRSSTHARRSRATSKRSRRGAAIV